MYFANKLFGFDGKHSFDIHLMVIIHAFCPIYFLKVNRLHNLMHKVLHKELHDPQPNDKHPVYSSALSVYKWNP